MLEDHEAQSLTVFESLDASELNEILISNDSRKEAYLDYLRKDGWFAGTWATGACVVLPDGRLIPVGDGHHDSTARHALQILEVPIEHGQPVQKLFVESGGVVVGATDSFASITGNIYFGDEEKYRTAARYVASLKNFPPEFTISASDTTIDIVTADFVASGYQL